MKRFSAWLPARNLLRRDVAKTTSQRATGTSFDLDDALMMLSPFDQFSARHAIENVGIWGAIGSAKTTGSAAAFARSYLAAGWGGLVCCVKPGEREMWERYARQTGRSDSLIIVSPGNHWRCNLLNYLLKRPGVIGSRTDLLTNLLMTIHEISHRGQKGGGENAQFFDDAVRQLVRNALEVSIAARGEISVSLLHELIMSMPQSHDEVHSERWQQSSLCYQLLSEGAEKPRSSRDQKDFDLAGRFFLREFLAYPSDTRGSVIATWSVMADALLRGQMAELFDTETNFIPDVSFHGAVIILDLPTKIYHAPGRLAQAAFTYLWQVGAEQRDVHGNPRPCFWFVDEAHELINEYSAQFLSTSREARCASVLISQNISNYFAACGGAAGRDRVESLLGCMNTHVFHANGHAEHNRWASRLFAKNMQIRGSFNVNRGGTHPTATGGGSETLESKVLEAEFTTLKKGGPENDFCAECIIFQGGRVFDATGDTYLKTTFRQERR